MTHRLCMRRSVNWRINPLIDSLIRRYSKAALLCVLEFGSSSSCCNFEEIEATALHGTPEHLQQIQELNNLTQSLRTCPLPLPSVLLHQTSLDLGFLAALLTNGPSCPSCLMLSTMSTSLRLAPEEEENWIELGGSDIIGWFGMIPPKSSLTPVL